MVLTARLVIRLCSITRLNRLPIILLRKITVAMLNFFSVDTTMCLFIYLYPKCVRLRLCLCQCFINGIKLDAVQQKKRFVYD